jgi:GrpB-like predicted nucleotidyltransferase (UPF0157 family)
VPGPIPVALAPYDPRWPEMARQRIAELKALGPLLIAVQHIGSTAIPGLAAKPIIDLMPVVSSLAALDTEQSKVEALGYDWHGAFGIEGRRYCTLADAQGNRIAQLHCFEAGSPHVERHIAFRDFLIAHPEMARAYEAEKRRARALHPDDSHAYSDEKAAWIRETEWRALDWHRAS